MDPSMLALLLGSVGLAVSSGAIAWWDGHHKIIKLEDAVQRVEGIAQRMPAGTVVEQTVGSTTYHSVAIGRDAVAIASPTPPAPVQLQDDPFWMEVVGIPFELWCSMAIRCHGPNGFEFGQARIDSLRRRRDAGDFEHPVDLIKRYKRTPSSFQGKPIYRDTATGHFVTTIEREQLLEKFKNRKEIETALDSVHPTGSAYHSMRQHLDEQILQSYGIPTASMSRSEIGEAFAAHGFDVAQIAHMTKDQMIEYWNRLGMMVQVCPRCGAGVSSFDGLHIAPGGRICEYHSLNNFIMIDPSECYDDYVSDHYAVNPPNPGLKRKH